MMPIIWGFAGLTVVASDLASLVYPPVADFRRHLVASSRPKAKHDGNGRYPPS